MKSVLSAEETVFLTNEREEIKSRLTQSHEGAQQQPPSLGALQGQSTVLSSCPQEVFSNTHHQLQRKKTRQFKL